MTHRDCVSLLLALPLLLGTACNDTLTPTEVPASVARTPTPTPVPGQPASMSGKVTTNGGGGLAGGLVVCQYRSATTAADGTYDLAALMSGKSDVKVFFTTDSNSDSYVFSVSLAPGPNTQNFFLYEY